MLLQEEGITLLLEQIEEAQGQRLAALEVAACMLIRLQTTENSSKYWSGMSMAHNLLFQSECRKSHRQWTLLVTFQVWAAAELYRRRTHPARAVRTAVQGNSAAIQPEVVAYTRGAEDDAAGGAGAEQDPCVSDRSMAALA
eukprot:2190291-Rhodomonas_salina.2